MYKMKVINDLNRVYQHIFNPIPMSKDNVRIRLTHIKIEPDNFLNPIIHHNIQEF